MAYQSDYVASVINQDRPIRELNKDGRRVAILPFGSEYKLRLINRRSTRCKVEVFIDGTDVLFGKKVVLNPWQTIDLERFLDSKESGSKFKWLSKEQGALQGLDPSHPDNGKISVRFYEEFYPSYTTYFTVKNDSFPLGAAGGNINIGHAVNSVQSLSGVVNCSTTTQTNLNSGVTGEGSTSDQKFFNAAEFQTVAFPIVIDIWLSGPMEEVNLTSRWKQEAKNVIAAGLSAHATKEQRELANAFLKVLAE